jgi:hypothetical protein
MDVQLSPADVDGPADLRHQHSIPPTPELLKDQAHQDKPTQYGRQNLEEPTNSEGLHADF